MFVLLAELLLTLNGGHRGRGGISGGRFHLQ
jgi:hypothetical protein